MKKIICYLISSILLFPYTIPYITYANDTISSIKTSNPSVNVDISREINDKIQDVNVDVDVQVLNPRTINFLDVAKINIINNTYNTDNKVDFTLEDILSMFPEYQLADIKEFNSTYSELRNIVVKDNVEFYAKQLEYLINNGILTRDNNFIYNSKDIAVTDSRYIHGNLDQVDSSESNIIEHKYNNSSSRISKTDFIVNLMKTENVHQSRPIGVQTPYKRVNQNTKEEIIDLEPLETSPYQDYMGDLGIDSAENDVIINHGVFRQLNIIMSNDVTEKYLLDAMNAGLIDEEDIGGVEGQKFLSTINSKIPVPGSWLINTPIRQQYIKDATLSSKEMELLKQGVTDEYYQELEKFQVTVKENVELLTQTDGLEYPWGNSYYYSVGRCKFGDVNSTTGVEIIKRPSIIEVADGFKDPNRLDDGYQYFRDETLTLIDAYMLAYKFLIASDTDNKIPEKTVVAIVSSYGMDFSKLTGEELTTVQYLIAKGIINPDDTDILYSTSRYITNKEMVDLLYRIHNKEARYELNVEMTDIDKDMLDKGYYKNNINLTSGSGDMSKVTYTIDESQSWTENMLLDRGKNISAYDYIYIKLPKGFDISKHSYILMGKDRYRATIPPYNYYINGGIEPTEEDIASIDASLEESEEIYSSQSITAENLGDQNNNKFVFKSKDGDYWVRYLIPKESSSNVILNINMGSKLYSIDGISGEGIYYLKDDDNVSSGLHKLALNDRKDISKRLIDLVVTNDEAKRLSYQDKINNKPKTITENTTQIETKGNLSYPETTTETTTYSSGFNDFNFEKSFNSIFNMILPLKVYATDTSVNDGEYVVNPSNDSGPLQASDKLGIIKIGPYTDEQMSRILLSGQSDIFVKEGDTWVVNHEAYQGIFANKLKSINVTYDEQTGGYYLNYPCLPTTIDFELATFVKELDMQSNGDGIKVPGYAQIESNGERVNLISSHDFKNASFNIEIISDKLLQNTKTGQKAFLNDTESFTMIGNNITKYPQDKMMVISLGDELFYNLDIILELSNDVKAVQNSRGKNTDINFSDEYEFVPVSIYNNNSKDYGLNKEADLMDVSYMIYDTNDPTKTGTYINLSALSYKASNFIYFKDKTTDGGQLEMLMVYYPKEPVSITNARTVDNGLISSTMDLKSPNDDIVDSTLKNSQNDYIFRKNAEVLSKFFFTAGGYERKKVINDELGMLEDVSDDILPSDYQYNIYFIVDEVPGGTSDQSIQASDAFNRFVRQLKNNVTGSTHLLENSVIASELNNGVIQNKADNTNSNVAFNYLTATTKATNISEDNSSYLFREPGSNNLYFRLQQPGSKAQSNSQAYLDIFKNRLYATKVTKQGEIPAIYFRSSKFYKNTPTNSIPLEILTTTKAGEIKTQNGEGIEDLKQSDNLKLSVEKIDKDSNGFGANVLVPIENADSSDIFEMALFTTIDTGRYLNLKDLLNEDNRQNILIDGEGYGLSFVSAKMTEWLQREYSRAFPNHNYLDAEGNVIKDKNNNPMNKFQPLEASLKTRYSSYKMNDKQIANTFEDTYNLLDLMDDKNSIYYSSLPKDLQSVVDSGIDSFSTLHLSIPYTKEFLLEDKLDLKPKNFKSSIGVLVKWDVKSSGNNKHIEVSKSTLLEDTSNKYKTPSEYYTKVLKDLSDTDEVYIEGKIPIPAGTTFVDQDGMLITALSQKIRTEMNYISDVNNALLTRLKLILQDVTFLSEVPKGSVVEIGDYKTVKLSEPQGEIKTGKNLKWDNLMLLPSNATEYNHKQVSDYTLMYKMMMSLMSIRIPLTEGANGSQVTLAQVMGNGLWSLPTKEELEQPAIFDKLRLTSGTAEYNSAFLSKNQAINIWTRETGDKSLPVLHSFSKSGYEKSITEEKVLKGETGYVYPILNLSPTLTVELDANGNYVVNGYIDSAFYNIDLKSDYVKYLETRNTDAYSPTEVLDSIRGYDMNGEYFRKWEMLRIDENFLFKIIYLLETILPFFLIVHFFIVTFIFLGQFIPSARTFMSNNVHFINFDYIKWVTFGLFIHTDDSMDTWPRYLIYAFFTSTLIFLLLNHYLIDWIINIWGFFI